MSEYIKPETLPGEALDTYLSSGWFRMQQSLHTDNISISEELEDLLDIFWLRFPLNEIRSHRSHRRIRKKNRRFRFSFQDKFELSEADEALYQAYMQEVPFDAYESVAHCLYEENRDTIFDTKCCRIYDSEKLIAVSIFDFGKTSAASIMQFYHPHYSAFSLGKYMILLTLDYMKAKGLDFYYPGYVIPTKQRLYYKLFLGLESAYYYHFESKTWKRFSVEMLVYKRMIEWDNL